MFTYLNASIFYLSYFICFVESKQELKEFLSEAIKRKHDETRIPNSNYESSVLSLDATHFLRFKLYDFPYPTFMLVNLLKRGTRNETVFDELEFYSVLNTLDNISETKEFNKFYAMLVDVQLIGEKEKILLTDLLGTISEYVNKGILSNRSVYLSLVARDDEVFKSFLKFQQNVRPQEDPEKYLFYHLFYSKRNNVYNILTQMDYYTDTKVRQYSQSLTLIDIFNIRAAGPFSLKMLFELTDPILAEIHAPESNLLLKAYVLEIKREICLLKFLQGYANLCNINLEDFNGNRKLLQNLLNFIEINFENFLKAEVLYKADNELKEKILKLYNPNSVRPGNNEFQDFCIICCLKLMLDNIKLDMKNPKYIQMMKNNLEKIHNIVSKIVCIKKKLQLCEFLYILLFARGKDSVQKLATMVKKIPNGTSKYSSNHKSIQKQSNTCTQLTTQPESFIVVGPSFNGKRLRSSDNSHQTGTNPTGAIHSNDVKNESGFICSKELIGLTLNFLQPLLFQIKEDLRSKTLERVDQLLESLDDALYRFNIFSKTIIEGPNTNIIVEKPHKVELVRIHSTVDPLSFICFDEEDQQEATEDAISIDGTEHILLDTEDLQIEKLQHTSIIEKMMSSPETLATLCATRADIREISVLLKVICFIFLLKIQI